MVSNDVLLKLEARAKEAEQLISIIRKEIGELSATISAVQDSKKSQLLREENERLEKEILKNKEELTNLQKKHGILQVEVPKGKDSPKPDVEINNVIEKSASTKNTTEKKQKDCKNNETEPNKEIHFGRVDLRVGKILEIIDHPSAENLYIEQIDVGEEKPREIISGLRKHIQKVDLLLRPVVVVCNLKPATLRGVKSYGMILCAVNNITVEPLWPPSNAVPGQRLTVEGFESRPDKELNPKDKVFETVAKELNVSDDKKLVYKNVFPVVVENLGSVTTKNMSACSVA